MDPNEIKYSDEIEKTINQKNTSCPLYGTEECFMLNPESCSECAVASLKPEKQEKAANALKRLREASHPEELSKLYTSEECLFCKGHAPEKADGVALFDLKKRDPEGDWTIALGKRKLNLKDADMILPLQVSCCKKCRALYRVYDYLPTVTGLVIAAAALIVTTASSVHKAAYAVAPWFPAALMALGFADAVGAAFALKAILAGALKKRMHVNVGDIPEIKKLMDEGWQEVMDNKHGVSAMVFAKERRKHGVCSAEYPEEKPAADPGAEPVLMGIWAADPSECGRVPKEKPEE